MIYLKLFLTFLEIGAFSFGGGMGMIALIRSAVLENGWMTEEEFLNFVAVSESTPGPIIVNISTFVGSSQAGIPGALLATLGAILPAFLIILLIAAVVRNLMKYEGVQAFLSGVRPGVLALLFGTAVTMGLRVLFGFSNYLTSFCPDWRAILIFALLIGMHCLWKKLRKKDPPPVAMILVSACLGMVLYGVAGQ